MSYGFGIVGLGLIADFHAKAILNLERGKLVACCSRVQEKADAFGKSFGCRGYSSMKAFLSHPGLDIVTVCTPSGYHLEPALAAAEAGKHLIVEKPLEVTLPRCDKIIEICSRKGVVLSGIFPSRFKDASRETYKAVSDGRFGKLVLGDAYVKWWRTQEYYDDGGWHGTWDLDGGGALINQSIHAIDLLQWFMGSVDSVQAYKATLGHQRIEVEDVAVAALQFCSGALGIIEGSTAAYPGFLKRIELSGTSGSVVMEEEDIKEWIFSPEQPRDEEVRVRLKAKTTSGGGAADPAAIDFRGHQSQFENVIDSIEGSEELLIDGTEARKAVEIIHAIYKSSKNQEMVRLPI